MAGGEVAKQIAEFFLANVWTIGIGAGVISVFALLKRLGILYRLTHKADHQSKRNGGELVAEVLKAHGVKYVFTLVGGHISPILVAAESMGIQVVDTRHEVTAVFAADAVARMSGVVGVAAVTAGPGLTNTVTAVKNAQMAESPLLLIGGAAATLLKGRGALQDIDQMSLFKPLCKFTASISCVRDIIPTVRKALQLAQSGTPGPVFVEFPIDVLYPIQVVAKEIGMKGKGKSIGQKIINMYLQNHLTNLFAGAWDERATSPLPVSLPFADQTQVRHCVAILSKAERPVIVLGSQVTLPPTPMEELRKSLESLGIPCFLGGMSRGLLGRNSAIQMRQKRKDALQEADVVILAGAVCDFRLGYGKSLSYKSKIIAVNRNKEQLYKNSDMFWMPSLAVQADAGNFLTRVAKEMKGHFSVNAMWTNKLKQRDMEKEEQNRKMSEELTDVHINPMKVLSKLEDVLSDNAIMVADGGDFVATAAYILRPRGALMWLDPGAFGTLGVGGGFALGAKLVRPDSEVWIIYGDGSLGYSVAEFDTFTRFKLPVIALVGNDACWSQIAREQVPMLGSNVACQLAYCDYNVVAEGYGGKGLRIDRTNEDIIEDVLRQAQKEAADGKSVLINCLIGKTSFREGSISV